MKAIIIKYKEKPLFVAEVRDLTLAQFHDLTKEVEKDHEEKEREIAKLLREVKNLGLSLSEAHEKIVDLYHQIAIDRGEEDKEFEDFESTSEEEMFGLEDSGEVDIGSEEPQEQEEVVDESVEESEESEEHE